MEEGEWSAYICLLVVFSISYRPDFRCNIGSGAYILGEATKTFPCCDMRVIDRTPIVTRSCQTKVTYPNVTVTCIIKGVIKIISHGRMKENPLPKIYRLEPG